MPSPARSRWLAALPNALSSARLVVALAFPFAPASWRLALVVAGGLSDWLDGLIARRFGVQSVSGALLDGIADKLLVVSVIVTLAASGVIDWWQVPLALARDLAVAGMGSYAAARREWSSFKRMVPRWPGKLTTLLLFAWFVVALQWPGPAEMVVFALTAAAAIVAAVDYLVQFLRSARDSSTTSGR